MKTKLLIAVVLLVVGNNAGAVRDFAVEWWNQKPGEEASRLIASLESGDGWFLTRNDAGRTFLGNGRIQVCSDWMSPALVYVDRGSVSNSFTISERFAISRAYHTCLRVVTGRAIKAGL